MALRQTMGLRNTLAMTTRMQAALDILGMPGAALCDHLAEAERKNPYLTVHMPAGYRAGSSAHEAVARLTTAPESLFTHVQRQIELSLRDPRDKRIAVALAQALEPTGWLPADLSDVAAACGCTDESLEPVLRACQEFEPAGLFARSLSECLYLQARDADLLTPAMAAVLDNLDQVAADGVEDLAIATGQDAEALADALKTLRGFDPKPGLAYSETILPAQPPELKAWRGAEGWQVELNRSTLPAIEISEMPDLTGFSTEDRRFARAALGEARWLHGAVTRRQNTLLAAASAMVARQTDYLEHGPGHLRPLALRDIAEVLQLHVSTISRATAYRRIETPQGVMALKSLFSRRIGDADDRATRDSAMAAIAKAIAAEHPVRPLSDAAIARQVGAEGPEISRRTVAKYRDLLGIPASYDRKRAAGSPQKTAGPRGRARGTTPRPQP